MNRLIPSYYSNNDLSTKKNNNGHKGLQPGHCGTPGAGGQAPSQKNHILKYNWLQQQREREQKEERRSQQVRR